MQGIALLAKTTVNATTKTATVTLTPSAPVISAFSVVSSNGAQICSGSYANVVCINGDLGASGMYERNVVFSWSATNADTYQLVDPGGAVIYSGAGTSINVGRTYLSTAFGYMINNINTGTFTLRAYKGGVMTSRAINPTISVWTCGAGCGGT